MDGKGTKIKIEQEPGSGGLEQSQNLIRLLAGFSAIKEKPTGAKAQRADILAAQVNEGNVKMVKAEWNKDLLDEMSSFPLAKHDDITDAASACFSALNVNGRPSVRSL
jgi:predicted phage terminase large subunit-like protein